MFNKGSFLLEYSGELITGEEGDEREMSYRNEDVGCYRYYFKDGKSNLW